MKPALAALFVILFGVAAAADYNFINPAGQKSSIKPVIINGKEYLAINKYYKTIFPNSTFDSKSNTLNHRGNIIKFTPSTFYLQCTSKGKTYSAQMSLPVIKPGSDLLVPLESFFIAINEFPGYAAGVDEKSIVMEKFLHEKQAVDKHEPDKNKSRKNDRTNNSIEEIVTGLDKTEDYEQTKINKDNTEIDNGKTSKLSKSFGHTSAGFLDKLELIGKIERNQNIGKVEKAIGNEIKFPENNALEKEMSYPPNLYVIPKNLIRRELKEIKIKSNSE